MRLASCTTAAFAVALLATGTRPEIAAAQGRLEQVLSWSIPARPAQIAGPIHFVGSNGLANYLIETPRGLVLIDGGMPGTAHHVEASIRLQGFDPKNIKWLLVTHAHIDHVGATAHLQKATRTDPDNAKTGARIAVMDRDVDHAQSGGTTDPVYGKVPLARFPAFEVDRILRDRDRIKLGNVTLTARRGAGHSAGATTWIARLRIGDKTYRVVFPCCTSVNPSFGPLRGHKLVEPRSYPEITDDYLATFKMLARLKPDIWLPAHTDTFDFWGKLNRARTENINAWLDTDQTKYCQYLALEKLRFDRHLERDLRAAGRDRDDPAYKKFFGTAALGRCRNAPAVFGGG